MIADNVSLFRAVDPTNDFDTKLSLFSSHCYPVRDLLEEDHEFVLGRKGVPRETGL